MSYPRKPASLRALEGNRGHRRIPVEPVGLGQPVAPSYLTAAQRERWDAIIASLPDGLLTAADISVLERMSVAWATFRQVTAELTADNLVDEETGVRNPLLAVLRQVCAEMHLCGQQLGLSPQSRTRLMAPPEAPDYLTELMTRNHA
jgi:P27 family predicted phage terminase small subunit